MNAWGAQDSQRRARVATGPRTFMRCPYATLNGELPEELDVAAVGVPTDWATGYRSGARFGPEGIRSASTLLRPGHPAFGLDITDTLNIADVGDTPVIPGHHHETLELVEEHLALLHRQSVLPLILGGDHSLAIAELRAAFHDHGPMALIQFDAHRDVLDDYFGIKHFHGTVYRRAVEEGLVIPEKSFQIGLRGSLPPEDLGPDDLGYNLWSWKRMRRAAEDELPRAISETVGEHPVALSFDIDFLDPAFAPGTGTPETGGPSTTDAMELFHALPPLNLVTASIVEVAPPYDSGEITSMAASVMAFEILANLARHKGKRHGEGAG